MTDMIDTDLIAIAELAFSEATEANLAEEDNRDAIHGAFNAIVSGAIGAGEIEVTGPKVRRLISDHLWMIVNNNGARRTQRFLKDLKAGQFTFIEVESILDLVIVAGKKRRTTLRYIDANDVQRMLSERADNLSKQTEAFAEFEIIAQWITDVLTRCGSVPQALVEHAIPLAAIFDEEAAS